jgi:uncharacterized protein YdeI (YjbR/CyaY-like superfamily)
MSLPHDLLDFESRAAWRKWLKAHHRTASEAWLVLQKKGYSESALSQEEAVKEALCFGWIDGKLKSLDQKRYSLRFSPRRSNSVWSVSNIRRVEELSNQGLMTEAGLQKVAEAHESGQWKAAILRERVDVIPEDLQRALRRQKGATAAYRSLPASRRKQLLHWLMTAKRTKTRQKRIKAILAEVTE